MLKYYTNNFEFIRSKIGSKIVVFVFILIILVITSFIIFSYYQSQMTYLGNSINIAGKNRFLTSNLMFQISEYLFEDTNKDVSKINSAIYQLESNILLLRQGGNNISGIDLKPLPTEFIDDWNIIYQKWLQLKTIIVNNIIKQDDEITSSGKSIDKGKEETTIETEALTLVDSSNILVTKLGEYVRNNSENLLFYQRVFIILDIAVIAAFVLYLTRNILKPILSLTSSISEVNRGTLNKIAQSKHNNNDDELSVIGNSFNYMVNYIKNIKNQDEVVKTLEKANEELKYKYQLKDEFIHVAAHELKTPIQPILGLCELLRDRKTDIVKDEEILDVIIRNSKRLMKLAEDILNVAR
ncbi:MAG TPA: histidine kinase dimerization/phospho-acceptor domain-containing protein, partial [Nitrososphaeraceae archaeon]|nr:histidine kinase dimerization/phospho-acceptor domain-containing protein [Nitrososphaeraceae archaeon]